MPPYVPDRGDIVHIDFRPQAGHEMDGPHNALVLSPKNYNERTHLALMCPITSAIKGYPFEVRFDPKFQVNGVVLADQVKCLDWVARGAVYKCRAPQPVMSEVMAKVKAILGL
jgi:mRNA interferase MazF